MRVYEAVAKKSRKWDEEARAKHWLLREDAGDGGATPNQLNQISAYRWCIAAEEARMR